MSDLRIHILAEDVPCDEFKYTNMENILTVQIRRWMEWLDCFAVMRYGFYIDYSFNGMKWIQNDHASVYFF
jgi:hypothetical protein